MEQPGVVAANLGLRFSLHFLNIFVHISGSIRPITLIWALLERSSSPSEVEHRWCQFWSKVMTSEVEERPRVVVALYGGLGVNGLSRVWLPYYATPASPFSYIVHSGWWAIPLAWYPWENQFMVPPYEYGVLLRDPELCYYHKVLKLKMTNSTFMFVAFSCHYFWRLWSLIYFWGIATIGYSQNEYLPIHLIIMGSIPQKCHMTYTYIHVWYFQRMVTGNSGFTT